MGEPKGTPSRWVPLLAGMGLEIAGGSIYVTSLYTNDLKDRFLRGPTGQSQVESIVFACNLGNWLPAAGFFNDSRLGGARNTALVGAVLTLLGYLGLWTWSAGLVHWSFWEVWAFWFLWGHGAGWFNNAAVATAAKNFPLQRGQAIGLIKAFFGLSGSLITQAYNLLFFGQTSAFMLFLSLSLSGLGACCAPFMQLVPPSTHLELDEPQRRFRHALGTVLALAALLTFSNVARAVYGASAMADRMVFAVMIVMLFQLGFVLVGNSGKAPKRREGSSQDQPGRPAEGTPSSEEAEEEKVKDASVCEAMRSSSYWLLFFIVFVGMGSGLFVLNNAAQMVRALGGSHSVVTVLVSLMSVANCLGRMAFGVLPDLVSQQCPRQLFLFIDLVIMTAAQALLAIGGYTGLFAGGIVAVLMYGGLWTLMPSLIGELFGVRSFATLYNFQSLAVSSGSLVFSTIIASRLYEEEALIHPAAGPHHEGCEGHSCFRKAALVTTAASALGAAAAGIFFAQARSRRAGHKPLPAE